MRDKELKAGELFMMAGGYLGLKCAGAQRSCFIVCASGGGCVGG